MGEETRAKGSGPDDAIFRWGKPSTFIVSASKSGNLQMNLIGSFFTQNGKPKGHFVLPYEAQWIL